jgi:hypothetical protein
MREFIFNLGVFSLCHTMVLGSLPFPELNVNDLMLDFDGSVLGGTVSALVERLTHAEHPGRLGLLYNSNPILVLKTYA